MQSAKLLIVDDDSDAVVALSRALKAAGLEAQISGVTSIAKGREEFDRLRPAVVVLDLSIDPRIGPESGLSLLRELSVQDTATRFIVLTGHSDDSYGVKALQAGAANFVAKPADIPLLLALIQDGIAQSALRETLRVLQFEHHRESLDRFVGDSKSALEVKQSLKFSASNSLPVLLIGETGTGKGVAAKIIHELSDRSIHPIVRYQPNFAAPDLVNSELFGHVRGAFTGADVDRAGLLEEANRGTLFLDEIEALPESTQVALLGVLQDRRFRRVGSNEEREINVRLVCATNQDPLEAQRQGKLRSDFYHRVAHFTVTLPPLRSRSEDIETLAGYFLEAVNEREGCAVLHISPEASFALKAQSWPGNVRELQSVIESAALRAKFEGRTTIELADLRLGPGDTSPVSANRSFAELVDNYKHKLITTALAECGENQVLAAKKLAIDRSTLRRILERKGN